MKFYSYQKAILKHADNFEVYFFSFFFWVIIEKEWKILFIIKLIRGCKNHTDEMNEKIYSLFTELKWF